LKNTHWSKILLVALILVSCLSFWQFHKNNELQQWYGYRLLEAYHDLGIHLRTMRVKTGQALISSTGDRKPLQDISPYWRNAAWEKVHFLRQHGRYDEPFHQLEPFFEEVQEGLYKIADGQGPLQSEEISYMKRVHAQLVKLEEIYNSESKLARTYSKEMAQLFYRGQVWPGVMNKMVYALGDNPDRAYRKYHYTRPEKTVDADNNEGTDDNERELIITGEKVTQEEALQRAQDFLGLKAANYKWELSGHGKSSTFGHHWSFSAAPKSNEGYAWDVEVLETGGYVIRGYRQPAIPSSNSGNENHNQPPEPKITAEEAIASARSFARDWGIDNMYPLYEPEYRLSQYSDKEGVYLIELVRRVNDIYYLPGSMQLEISGTGSIVSFERLNQVLQSQKNITAPPPKLTREEARAQVNKGYKVTDGPLIFRTGSNELKYVFIVEEAGAKYEVWIDALTGEEKTVVALAKNYSY